jgi:hypothetical protein
MAPYLSGEYQRSQQRQSKSKEINVMYWKRGWLVVVILVGLLAAGATVLAQGDDQEPDFTVDWCVIENGQRVESAPEIPGLSADEVATLLQENIPEPGDYDVSIPVLSGGFDSFADLFEMSEDELENLEYTDVQLLIRVVDRGVDCRTGDPLGVERLWDDKVTMVIFRDANYDVSFYWPNGRHIHTTPFWMLVGPYEPGQFIDEELTIGGDLRLYYRSANMFEARWYGPDGTLALVIPFTYPEPCDDTEPGYPRICD